MAVRTETDPVFRLAGVRDPFTGDNPYLRAFMALEIPDRKQIARQVVLLCATIEGLDPLGALELLAQVAPFMEGQGLRCPAGNR
ncbi:MAG TPA: hypothetical protein DEQ80_12155 [Anaerolinea thermolimosa]|uniref:Uncharacterized protein n=1 Tax=Anaerolinea thermolimosa TaxID=229919 RepID=A0A3D1JJ38_9CHLR|nr:hypothetical protein [Anaerolinea thermolimosa]